MHPGPSSSQIARNARINAMRFVLSKLDYPNKNRNIARNPDPLIVGSAKHIYETGEHTLDLEPTIKEGKS